MDGEEFAFRLRRGVHSTWTKRASPASATSITSTLGSPPPRPGRSVAGPRRLRRGRQAAFRRESLRWHPDKYRGDDPEGAREMQHKLAMARGALLPGRVAFDEDLAPFVRYTEYTEVEVPDEREGWGESGEGARTREPEPAREPEPHEPGPSPRRSSTIARRSPTTTTTASTTPRCWRRNSACVRHVRQGRGR